MLVPYPACSPRLSADEIAAWRRGEYDPPGGEAFADVVRRITAAADELRGAADRVLVITHGGAIRAVLRGLLGVPPRALAPCPSAAFCVVELADVERLVAYAVTVPTSLDNERASTLTSEAL